MTIALLLLTFRLGDELRADSDVCTEVYKRGFDQHLKSLIMKA